jgi:hypothetical protein
VYPLKIYKSLFLEEENFGSEDLNQIGKIYMIAALRKG